MSVRPPFPSCSPIRSRLRRRIRNWIWVRVHRTRPLRRSGHRAEEKGQNGCAPSQVHASLRTVGFRGRPGDNIEPDADRGVRGHLAAAVRPQLWRRRPQSDEAPPLAPVGRPVGLRDRPGGLPPEAVRRGRGGGDDTGRVRAPVPGIPLRP